MSIRELALNFEKDEVKTQVINCCSMQGQIILKKISMGIFFWIMQEDSFGEK